MTPKGCHYRVGTKCQEMTPEEIEKRFVATLNVPTPDICEMKSRRQDLSFEVLKIYLKEHRVEFKDEYFDSTFELRNEEGKYNEMAYLLSDQFNESIKVCRFKGKGGNLVMRKEFGNGCLFKIYNEVKDYMQSQENIVKTYFDAGTRRDEYLYNQVAFVEAWKNAILHNNYAEKQYPAIYLFDDHLEVFSNGNPLRNVSFDEFIMGKSRPINRQLTKIAMNIDITDQTGKGNKDIVEIYGKDAFEIMEHTLTVKIPYNKLAMDLNTTSDDAQNDAQNDAQKTLEEKIIFIIKGNDKITRIKMAELLGVSKPTIERAIKASNKIKYVGPSKGGHWEITE
jgi:predicted HTH transcriptional regulator